MTDLQRLPWLLLLAASCSAEVDLKEAPTEPAPPGMVWIPGASFQMGSDSPLALPDERPVHEVRVSGFWLDIHEVTNAEFALFVEQTHYQTTA